MKRVLIVIVAVCFSVTQLMAQESTFVKGDKVANFGLGIGSSLYSTGGIVPPLTASLEVGVVEDILEKGVIGVGGYLGFSSYGSSNYYKVTNFVIGPRGTFHYPFLDRLDTYAGLMIGYNIVSWNWEGVSGVEASSSGLTSSFFIGGRYYFSESFAGMLELGSGFAYLNLGVALKF